MAFDISLSSGMRADLISLQGTAQLLNRTQGRLSSGKQVNSAVDDPSRYFAAQDHLNHASDLSSRKSDMGEAIQSVKAANLGITGITGLINQAQGLVQSAGSANTTTRASLAAQFNTIRTQIDQLASDSGYNGKNFLEGAHLNVLFNESGNSLLVVQGFSGNSSGLGITTAANATGTTYNAGETLGATSVAQNATVALAHSGVVKKEDITVTRTLAYTGQALATKTAAAALTTGASIALTHAGAASSIKVYETLTDATSAAISSANATAQSVTNQSATFTVTATSSAAPTTITLTTTKTLSNTGEAAVGASSATTINGAVVTLGHVGVASSVSVHERLRYSAAAISSANSKTANFSNGSATFTLSAAMITLTAADITVKSNGANLTAGVTYTATLTSSGVTITLLTAQPLAINVSFNYDATLASADFTVSTGSSISAATITFNRNLTGAVKVDYTSKQSGVVLTRGVAYTATFDSGTGQTKISLLSAQTNQVAVSVDYNKTLHSATDYTVSAGTSASAGNITFKHSLSGAVKVDFKAATTVATGKYTISSGSTTTAGSLTFNSKVTGQVQVTYSVNHTLWGTDAAIQTDIDNLNNAILKLRTQAASMAANLSVITTRQDWSAGMISNLQTGSDNLTLADMNEEGANMLALQTRQQLGIQALSLASQANQSVMRLFG